MVLIDEFRVTSLQKGVHEVFVHVSVECWHDLLDLGTLELLLAVAEEIVDALVDSKDPANVLDVSRHQEQHIVVAVAKHGGVIARLFELVGAVELI